MAVLLSLFVIREGRAEELVEGANLVRLTTDGKSVAWSWAYRGNRIAYLNVLSDSQSQLRIMLSDGTEDRAVSPAGTPFFVEWSWNGEKLSYMFSNLAQADSQGGVFVYDVDSGRSIPVSLAYPFRSLMRFFGGGRGGSSRGRGGSRRRSGFGRSRPGIGGPPIDGPYWSADSRMVAYQVSVGDSYNQQTWVANAQTGQFTQILPGRGEVGAPRWSPNLPSRITLEVEASGRTHNVASVNPDGTELVMLTDIGAERVRIDSPKWSPSGEWIVFTSNLEMIDDERDRGRRDVWIARPDGSEARNLTQASTNVVQDQLSMFDVHWSWDSRWLLGIGQRFDQQGRDIFTLFLIDPVNGGYEILLTSDPERTAESESWRGREWTYDSTKFAVLSTLNDVRNWGSDTQFENPRTSLFLYDMKTRERTTILSLSDQQDRRRLTGRIFWSPDSRSLLVTIEDIISADGGITLPDVYRIDLPPSMISPEAAQHDGPPIGRGLSTQAAGTPSLPPPNEVALLPTEQQPAPSPGPAAAAPSDQETIKTLVYPKHLRIEEITPLLADDYTQYIKEDEARNLYVFSGPVDIYTEFVKDVELVDFPVQHVLVDLLAIEMNDEANRELGFDWTYTTGRYGFFQPEGLGVADLTPGFGFIPPAGIPFPNQLQSFNLINPEELLGSTIDPRDIRGIIPGATLSGLRTFPGAGQVFRQGVGTLPDEFFVRLSTLEQDGKVTILANPRTVGASGKVSLIQIRKTVNFFFSEGFDLTGRQIVEKGDQNTLTEGRITPTVLAGGKIHMAVEVTVGTLTFNDEGLPQVVDRKAETEVTVAPGETIVIGGLRQQEMMILETRTPILGSIPFLGTFFKKDTRQIKHSILTILITPQIVGEVETGQVLPDPMWPEYQWNERYATSIMQDSSIEDEADHMLTPEWTEKVLGSFKSFFGMLWPGGGDEEGSSEDEMSDYDPAREHGNPNGTTPADVLEWYN